MNMVTIIFWNLVHLFRFGNHFHHLVLIRLLHKIRFGHIQSITIYENEREIIVLYFTLALFSLSLISFKLASLWFFTIHWGNQNRRENKNKSVINILIEINSSGCGLFTIWCLLFCPNRAIKHRIIFALSQQCIYVHMILRFCLDYFHKLVA